MISQVAFSGPTRHSAEPEKPCPSSAERVKVLYIAGSGRSGTTILGNVLGAFEGFFSAGEVRSIWEPPELHPDRAATDGSWRCGCGALVRECQVWKPVFDQAFGGFGKLDCEAMSRLRVGVERTRYAPLMAMPLWRRLMKQRMATYAQTIGRLYRAVHQVAGCRVIVDESKGTLLPHTLALTPGLDVYIVHMVRDPRAYAFSLKRTVARPDTLESAHMPRVNAALSSIVWAAENIAGETVAAPFAGRYMRVRYEEFVAHPRQTVMRIMDMLGEAPASDPFVSENEIDLQVNHTVWGNPNRMRVGRTKLALDEEWKSKLPWRDKVVINALTWPLLIHYGYRLGT